MNHKLHDREDGLAHCKTCGGGEGSLPSECPGVRMTAAQDEAVYAGNLNYANGKWWRPALEEDQLPAFGTEDGFDAAWREMEAGGYRYGRDALAGVRLGWQMRDKVAKRGEPGARPPVGGLALFD